MFSFRSARSTDPWEHLTSLKAQFQDPEVWRDLDRNFGQWQPEHEICNYVWHGTENANFRRRFLTPPDGAASNTASRASAYEWRPPLLCHDPDLTPHGDDQRVDVDTLFPRPTLVARLFAELTRDFYKRKSAPSLFNALYDTPFIQPYSIRAVRQLIKRLNSILTENQTALDVINEDGRYRLKPRQDTPVRIRISRDPEKTFGIASAHELAILNLLNDTTAISVSEICKQVGLQPRRCQILLKNLVELGKIQKHKNGWYLLRK